MVGAITNYHRNSRDVKGEWPILISTIDLKVCGLSNNTVGAITGYNKLSTKQQGYEGRVTNSNFDN